MSKGGFEFTIPAHPEYYLAVTLDDPTVRVKLEAKNKAKILEHDVYTGVVQVMKDFINKSVNEKWFA